MRTRDKARKISNALRLVREDFFDLLEHPLRERPYICATLVSLDLNDGLSPESASLARQYIRKQLAIGKRAVDTLETWILVNALSEGRSCRFLFSDRSRRRATETRVEWLTHMINYLDEVAKE